MKPTVRERMAAAWAAVKGDGCSQVPDWTPEFNACCNRHDADYRTGADENGEQITRAKSDARLRACLHANGRTWAGRWIVPAVYWAGVRAFGWMFWNRARGSEHAGNA